MKQQLARALDSKVVVRNKSLHMNRYARPYLIRQTRLLGDTMAYGAELLDIGYALQSWQQITPRESNNVRP